MLHSTGMQGHQIHSTMTALRTPVYSSALKQTRTAIKNTFVVPQLGRFLFHLHQIQSWAVLQRLGQVWRLDALAPGQVSDRGDDNQKIQMSVNQLLP